jgi:hypothetical protein
MDTFVTFHEKGVKNDKAEDSVRCGRIPLSGASVMTSEQLRDAIVEMLLPARQLLTRQDAPKGRCTLSAYPGWGFMLTEYREHVSDNFRYLVAVDRDGTNAFMARWDENSEMTVSAFEDHDWLKVLKKATELVVTVATLPFSGKVKTEEVGPPRRAPRLARRGA